MPSHNYPKTSQRDTSYLTDLPPRPKTPVDYVPEPFHKIAPANMLEQLISEHQKGEAIPVHEVSRELLIRPRRRAPALTSSPTMNSRSKNSSRKSFQSLAKGMAKGLGLGKAATRKSEGTRGRENDKSGPDAGGSKPWSKSSRRSLYNEPVLPRLTIPKASKVAEASLKRARSTDTLRSPSWAIVELSPTSRELRHQLAENHSDDINAELRNMISARRGVRKLEFGRDVEKHCQARPGWDDNHPPKDYTRDMHHLKNIKAELQKQKDTAQELAKEKPHSYPKLRSVQAPGCSDKVYWQHRSY